VNAPVVSYPWTTVLNVQPTVAAVAIGLAQISEAAEAPEATKASESAEAANKAAGLLR